MGELYNIMNVCVSCASVQLLKLSLQIEWYYDVQFVPESWTDTHRRIESDVVSHIVFKLWLIIKKKKLPKIFKDGKLYRLDQFIELWLPHHAYKQYHNNIIFAYYKTRTSYAVVSCLLLIRPANRYHKLCTYNTLGYNIIYTDIILKIIRGTKRA